MKSYTPKTYTPKVIHPPVIKLPDKLPLETQVDKLLDRVSNLMERNPVTKAIKKVEGTFPTIASINHPTPFGTIRTPELRPPSLRLPELDKRKKDIIKASVGADMGFLVAQIPVVGDIIGQSVTDTYKYQILGQLTPEEMPRFRNFDKISPLVTVAAIQTFARR